MSNKSLTTAAIVLRWHCYIMRTWGRRSISLWIKVYPTFQWTGTHIYQRGMWFASSEMMQLIFKEGSTFTAGHMTRVLHPNCTEKTKVQAMHRQTLQAYTGNSGNHWTHSSSGVFSILKKCRKRVGIKLGLSCWLGLTFITNYDYQQWHRGSTAGNFAYFRVL